MNTIRNKVPTIKNTSFEDWKLLCDEEFERRSYQRVNISPLRTLHAWEGGDTPASWVDFLNRQRILQERNVCIVRDNPKH